MQKGNISVQTENIFPIIKKFLYSDHEIFLRELVSNAVDATTKLKALARRGEVKGDIGNTNIEVLVNKDDKQIIIRDRGIGMTEEEVKKYLNQVAFSSAEEFLEKYKDDSSNIIGHFGLGFYSAFMVANKVEVVTKSYREDAPGVTWICEGNPEYEIGPNDKTERGTDIILHISDDNTEFLDENRIESLLEKYCKFLPVPIKYGEKDKVVKTGEGDDAKEKTIKVDHIINNSDPAWRKNPSELNDEDYLEFYRELYPMTFQEPLFWIHLNIDYPFNLTGILYFPHLGNSFELQKNKIQLYSNQVYVTDDVKDIVPEFLTLLHGVIDSPDIPLNVSRSYLQADSNVRKITGYITKKVAEKLNDLFKSDREGFEKKWPDLGVFVKYGMMSDDKFYDRAQKFALLASHDGKHHTFEEYQEKVRESQKNKDDKLVFLYTHDTAAHHAQIEACENRGYDVLVFDHLIDTHFIQQMEYKMTDVSFVRVDADTVDKLIEKDETAESVLSEEDQKKLEERFKEVVDDASRTVILRAMSPGDQPVLITYPEFMRRMKEMQSLQGSGLGNFPDAYNVVVNTNHPLIHEKVVNEQDQEKQQTTIRYLYDLALLNQGMLKGKELSRFVKQSLDLVK